jgi:adenosylcobinamide-phosphate synthase
MRAAVFCIGLRSLREHTLPIARRWPRRSAAGASPDLLHRQPRHRQSSEGELAKAGVESLLENGNDAVFGTLFWFLVAGGPGALLFRLANTLDAMWGYRNARFLHFGWAAARIDDASTGCPARLTAYPYAWLGQRRGPGLLEGAGARLEQPQCRPGDGRRRRCTGPGLGGPAIYDGEVEQRPPLGRGLPQGPDIVRAWRLVAMSTALWLAVACAVALLCLGGLMLEHGGNLNDAARHYGRPRSQWLDLSTGINPRPYPAPAIAADAWHRLPEPRTRWNRPPAPTTVRPACWPWPARRRRSRHCRSCACARMAAAQVVVAAPIYAEHAHCWQRAGHLCAKCRMTAG